MAVHIVTDSTSCLPEGFAEQHGVTVVPLKVSLNGTYYRDGVDITRDEFYTRLAAGASAATTQPSPDDFATVYRSIFDRDPDGDIISIHISSRMSGTLNAALTGRNLLNTVHVQFVDTWSAGLGVGFPVMKAVELTDAGAPLWKIIAETQSLCLRTHAYFVLETLTYLQRGGRIGKAAAIAAGILKIKPVLTYVEGVTDVVDRPRTKRVALERLWAIIDKHMRKGVEYVGLHYAANRQELESFQRDFTARYNVPSVLTQLSPVVGTYSGPDMIGCALCEQKPRQSEEATA